MALRWNVDYGVPAWSRRCATDARNAAEKADFERRITLMRRTMLVLDIVAFSSVGYLFGQTIAGGWS